MFDKNILLLSKLRNELRISRSEIISLGKFYHEFIESYVDGKIGVFKLREILSFLYGSEDEFEKPVFPELVERVGELETYIPAMRKELSFLERLREGLDEVREIFHASLKRGILLPEEHAKVAYDLSNLRIYYDYLHGYNCIRTWILERKGIRGLLDHYQGIIKAFIYKTRENRHFYMGGVNGYAFLTFFGIDAHNNSILRKLIKTKDYQKRLDICVNEIPEQGLERVLFQSREKVLQSFYRSQRERTFKRGMCLPSALRARFELKRLENYYQELYRNPPFYL